MYFLHIGKTAGNALKTAIRKNNFLWSNLSISKPYVIVMTNHQYKFSDLHAGDYCFFVTRDPISRFVSGFNSRLRQGRPRIFNPWTEDESKAFAQFKTACSLAEALYSEDKEIALKASNAMLNIKHVNTSYWSWFGSKSALLSRKDSILFYLRQEYLNSDIKSINERLGLGFHSLPDDKILSNTRPNDSNTFLTDIAIRNLKQWYYKDYEFLELLEREIYNYSTLD